MPAQLDDEQLDRVCEEFIERIRRGEYPSISEYTGRFPSECAGEVEEFLSAVAMLENLKPEPQAAASLPETFGRYRIEKTLGEGGMGAVYLARDTQLDRQVALKTPKFNRMTDKRIVDRFYREARAAATLQHPNICPVFDVGQIDQIHFITMAYIEGRPLNELVSIEKPLSVNGIVRVVRKVALAIQEAHDRGIIHRDLKPANIMIDRRNEPIVMDFGLARYHRADDDSQLTQAGTVLGSPGYLSPEQIQGHSDQVGPRCDIYALGTVLFELLTGRLPFEGDGSILSMLSEALANDAPDVRTIRAGIDPRLAAICKRALARRAGARFSSMAEFGGELAGFLKASSEPAKSDASRIRADHQCEMVREMCRAGQYAAAVTILEKMAAVTDADVARHTKWAKAELPKVKAKAASNEVSRSDLAASRELDDIWNQETSAASPVNTLPPTPALQRFDDSVPKWVYWLIPVPLVVLVFLVLLVLAGSFGSDPDAARPETDDPAVVVPITAAAPTSDPAGDGAAGGDPSANDEDRPRDRAGDRIGVSGDRPRSNGPKPNGLEPNGLEPNSPGPNGPFPGGRRGSRFDHFLSRLMENDANGDGALSRVEIPPGPPFAPVLREFDSLDQDNDGKLNATELRNVRPRRRPGF